MNDSDSLLPLLNTVLFVLALFIAGRLLLKFQRRFLSKASRRPTGVQEYSLYQAGMPGQMLCPKCGAPMQSGFTASRLGLARWMDASELTATSVRSFHDESKTASMSHGNLGNGAWRCEACSMLFIDHSCFVDLMTANRR